MLIYFHVIIKLIKFKITKLSYEKKIFLLFEYLIMNHMSVREYCKDAHYGV